MLTWKIMGVSKVSILYIYIDDRIRDRVTPEFKEMLNKCQPINLKIKNKIRK